MRLSASASCQGRAFDAGLYSTIIKSPEAAAQNAEGLRNEVEALKEKLRLLEEKLERKEGG